MGKQVAQAGTTPLFSQTTIKKEEWVDDGNRKVLHNP